MIKTTFVKIDTQKRNIENEDTISIILNLISQFLNQYNAY